MKLLLSIILTWMLFVGNALSQQIELRNAHGGDFSYHPERVWKGDIINQGQPVQAYFQAEFSQNGLLLYRCVSQQVWIGEGVSPLASLGLGTLEGERFIEEDLEGDLNLCLKIILLQTEEILARDCQEVHLTDFTIADQASRRQRTSSDQSILNRQPVRIQLTSQLSSWDNEGSNIPGNFYQINGQIPFSVQEVPIQISFNYASFRTEVAWWRNMFQISLDQQKLSQILRKKQQETIAQAKDNLPLNDSLSYLDSLRREIRSLSYYENKLKSPAFAGFDTLEQYYSKVYNLRGTANYDQVLSIKDSLYQADPLEYQKLAKYLTRMESYQRLQGEIERIQALEEKLQIAESQLKSSFERPPSLPTRDKIYKWLSFKNLQIGTVYPSFSSLTLNGIALQGAYISYEQPKWCLDLTGGKWIYPQTILSANPEALSSPMPNLISGRLRWGNESQGFIGASFLHVQSDSTDWRFHPEYTSSIYQSIGFEGAIPLPHQKGYVKGELVAQLPTPSLAYEWSGRIESQYQAWQGGQLFLSYQGRTNNFSAIANPWLLQPLEQYLVEVDQRLWKDRITISGFARQDFLTLLPLGSAPPMQVLAGFATSWESDFMKLKANYAPVFNQLIQEKESSAINQTTGALLSLESTIQANLSEQSRLDVNASVYWQFRQEEGATISRPNLNSSLALSFAQKLQLQAGGSYFAPDYVLGQVAIWNLNSQVSLQVFKKISIRGGLTSFSQEGVIFHQFIGGLSGAIHPKMTLQVNGSYGDLPVQNGIRNFNYENGWFIRTSLQMNI